MIHEPKINNKALKKMLVKMLGYYFIGSAIVITVFTILTHNQNNLEQEINYTREDNLLTTKISQIQNELNNIETDLLVLSKNHEIINIWKKENYKATEKLSYEFQNLALVSKKYKQIRLIDEHGDERIRVDYNNDRALLIKNNKLQNKKSRYYFIESFSKNKDEVYISPLDLNIENNTIEFPNKPMIRMGTPVFDSSGNKRGIVILNYFAQTILDQLTNNIENPLNSKLMLINNEGYFLKGPTDSLEWGFMYDNKKQNTFKLVYGQLWDTVKTYESYQCKNSLGLFTIKTIRPFKLSNNQVAENIKNTNNAIADSTNYLWKLISFVPYKELHSQSKSRNRKSLLYITLLLLVFLAILISLSKAQYQKLKSQLELKESEELLKIYMNSTSDIVYTLDVNQKLTGVFGNWPEKFGFSKEKILGKTIKEFFGEFADIHLKANEKALNNEFVTYEWSTKIENQEKYFQMDLAPLILDNKIIGIHGVGRDISLRKYTERKTVQRLKIEKTLGKCSSALLQLDHEARRNCLQHVLEGTDVSRTYIFKNVKNTSNELCMQLTHEYCAPNVQPISDFPALKIRSYEKSGFIRWHQLLSENQPIMGHFERLPESEKQLLKPSAVKSLIIIPIWVNKKWYGFLGLDDIQNERLWSSDDMRLLKPVSDLIGLYIENKQNQKTIYEKNIELEKVNITKDKFFSIIAHDLKNPFFSISGFSELLLKNYEIYKPEKVVSFIKAIHEISNASSKLLDNLLAWSMSQSGNLEFKPEHIVLSKLVQETVLLVENAAKAKDIFLTYSIPESLVVFVDKNMMSTIIRNLITNAIKFTPQNGTIKITAHEKPKEVSIAVSDSGIGMNEETKNNIFLINKKASRPGTENEKGSGLGLILCKEFIEKHGGTIFATSKAGKGSTFTFTLPML